MNYQRWGIGVVAGLLLIAGVCLYWTPLGERSVWTGLCIRVGLLLGVIWLAMPQLAGLRSRMSTIVLGSLVAVLVLAALKPKLFSVVSAVLAVGLAINFVLGWASRTTRPPGK